VRKYQADGVNRAQDRNKAHYSGCSVKFHLIYVGS
jgi:hypothetical protein